MSHTLFHDPDPFSVVRAGRWFSQLTQAQSEALLACSQVRYAAAGEALFVRGDEFCGLYCVLQGRVRLSMPDAQDHDKVIGWVRPSQWLGELSLFDRQPRALDAIADLPTALLHLSTADIDELLMQEPTMVTALGQLLASKLRVIIQGLASDEPWPQHIRKIAKTAPAASGARVLPFARRTSK